MGKFEDRVDEGIFLSHSSKSKASRCYNKRKETMVDSADVCVDEQRDIPMINDDNNFSIYEDLIESDEKEKEKSKP